jgi:CHAT domain-containing protein
VALSLSAALALAAGPTRAAAPGDQAPPAAECRAPAPEASARAHSLPPAFEAAEAARETAESGAPEGVAEKLDEIVDNACEIENAGFRARLLLHAGRSYTLLAQRVPDAKQALTLRAVDALTGASRSAADAGEQRLYSYAVGYLAEIYEQQKRLDDAAELTRRAIFAAQEARTPDALYRWRWQLGRIQREMGKPHEALENYRGAVTVLGEIREQLAVAPEADVAFRREVEPVYVGLVDLLLRLSAEIESNERKQALLVEARDVLESWKAAELRDYFRDPCLDERRKATPDEIPGTVVVYPIVLDDRTELVVSEGGKLESYVSPVGREALVAEVREYRRKLEKRTTRQYLRHSRTLYDWLIRPIEPALASDTQTVVFVPGGALRTIPFAALNDRSSGTFLIERFPIAVTPGLTLTEPQPIHRERARMLVAGISESVQGYGALQNVEPEIDAVSAVFPSEKLVNSDFVVSRFESELSDERFEIVHVASHGEFSPDVSQSFLLAYDGKLSMDRLADLVSATRFREDQPLELLALSACRTAAGDDRSALGLAGVALRAGALSALATLWSVNDQATTELMTEFYAQLGDSGVSRAEALQRAQLKLLQTHHYRHPSYWSAFLLISSWL